MIDLYYRALDMASQFTARAYLLIKGRNSEECQPIAPGDYIMVIDDQPLKVRLSIEARKQRCTDDAGKSRMEQISIVRATGMIGGLYRTCDLSFIAPFTRRWVELPRSNWL